MKLYPNIHSATFLARPNRFIARCALNGQEVIAHVKNTGRCRELLLPHAPVYLTENDDPKRKTRYDLVTVMKDGKPVNLDSQAPNRVFGAWAASGGFLPNLTDLKPETVYGASRFDFAFRQNGRQGYAEIKGVTLETDGVAYFPDAPTLRGVKHIEELIRAQGEGCLTYLCFVIPLMGVHALRPNDATHPAFGTALRRAREAGVTLLALTCDVAPDGFSITGQVPVELGNYGSNPARVSG